MERRQDALELVQRCAWRARIRGHLAGQHRAAAERLALHAAAIYTPEEPEPAIASGAGQRLPGCCSCTRKDLAAPAGT